MITIFLSSLFNTIVVACIGIVLVVLLRIMCNTGKEEVRGKFIRFYDILLETLGCITGVLIIIYIVIVL